MNIAGPLASLIFAITVLTVFGGLFAYGVYKARERTRKKPAPTKEALTFFVEYELPGSFGGYQDDNPVALPMGGSAASRPWGLYAIMLAALGGMVLASLHYYESGKRMVLQGAWSPTGARATKEFPGPPERGPVPRGPALLLDFKPRPASLFPKARFDANHDGVLQPEERAALHAETPLNVLLSVDDCGHAQGLSWLVESIDRHKLGGMVTFFLTANYLEGKSSFLGGPITPWWTLLAGENFVGLHGLTHEGGTEWPRDRWSKEDDAAMKEISSRVSLPKEWPAASYPWGARAPYLTFNDDYFAALEQVSPTIRYDASMVVHPSAPLPPPPTPLPLRDEPWPFSLDAPLPEDVERPFSAKQQQRVAIGSHALYEVPVYAWAVSKNGQRTWIPSLDVNLFDLFHCEGDGPNEELVAAFEQNLMAHYNGNRAPFHLGLHAQNYTADKKCERRTVAAILDKIDALAANGFKIEYQAAPRLLAALIAEP